MDTTSNTVSLKTASLRRWPRQGWLRLRRSALALAGDCKALAAVEFAMVVPLMLVLFFGTVELGSAVAISRKVTLMAHTLSDLTSQSPPAGVSDTDINNYFTAANSIMWPYNPGSLTPYPNAPMQGTISELYIDPNTLAARVQWSKGSAPRAPRSSVVIPAALAVGGTYLIYSEVSYAYAPPVGYVLKTGITLSDFAYTRPRQSACVTYPASASGNSTPCPQL